MALKLLRDITYPDYPQMIEIRVVKKWPTRGNTQYFSYLFVDETAPSAEEAYLDRMVTLQQCYRITNYTTTEGRNFASVVPHPTSVRISRRTHFDLVINENIPAYYFDFVPLETLDERLPKGSPLSDFVGRAELITEMITTTERRTGNTLHLRRVTIMDDRSRTVEVTLWEDKGRAVDRAGALHQIVAVTATVASKFLQDVQLSSTNATMFFVDPPIPNLQTLKERFRDLPHTGAAMARSNVSASSMDKVVISDLHMKSQPRFTRVQFVCEATITKIFGYRSWYYLACQYCSRRVNQEITKEGDIVWRCLMHDTMTEPMEMYVLNTVITDDTGSADAIFFNSVVEQLTGIPCHQMIATGNYVDPKVLPDEIKRLHGQRMQLQITIKPDGSVNVKKVIEPQLTLALPHSSAETSTLQHPATPARRQRKRLSESSSTDTPELPLPHKKTRLSFETTED